MNRFLILTLVLWGTLARASNVAIIDGGIDDIYLQVISNQVLLTKCYSVDDSGLVVDPTNPGQDPDIFKYYRYAEVSACPNGTTTDNFIGVRSILHSQSHSKGPIYELLESKHMTGVVDIFTQYSEQKIALINSDFYRSESSGPVAAPFLEPKIAAPAVIEALALIAQNYESLNIRVVNMSFGNDFFGSHGFCDNQNFVEELNEIRELINFLVARGIIFVAAAGNRVPVGESTGQEFPACLSNVISVGGILNSFLSNGQPAQRYYGATARSITFLDDPYPLDSNGDTLTGTSFAAPKVAGTISQMMAINPLLENSRILEILEQTSTFTGRVYYPNTDFKYDTNRLSINPIAALNGVRDEFWSDIYFLIKDVIQNISIGWNTGSNQHPNGAQFLFSSDGLIQQKQNETLQKQSSPTASQKNIEAGDPVVLFSLEPYDIDTSDEVEVIVNGISYGFLEKTESNTTGPRQTVCIDPANLKSDGTDNSVQLKLKSNGETWGVKNVQVQAGVADDSCLSKDGGLSPLPESEERLVGTSELFGNAYTEGASNSQVPLDFSVSTLSPENFSTTEVKRDLRVSFIAKSGDTSSTDNSTIVRLNGQEVYRSEEFFGSDERSFEFILSRNELSDGSNTLTFLPRRTGSSMVWGIRNISVEYIEPITLSLDQTDNQRYGYLETPTRLTGLRTNLAITDIEKDYLLSVTGWGIDLEDENEVFLNGNSLGNLSKGLVTSLAPETTIILPQSLLLEGLNQVEFVQREPSSTWQGELFIQWGVEQLNLTALAPDFSNPSVSILTDVLDPSTPFTLSANITNIGEGYAKPSTLRFVLSQDDVISAAQDTVLGSVQTIGINAGASVEFTIEAQTNLVDQGLFVGACIQSIDDETRTNNNCSPAVELKSAPATVIMAPIYFLLLDD